MDIITAGDKQLTVCPHCQGSSLCQYSTVVWREELGEKTLRFYYLSCPKCGKGIEKEEGISRHLPISREVYWRGLLGGGAALALLVSLRGWRRVRAWVCAVASFIALLSSDNDPDNPEQKH